MSITMIIILVLGGISGTLGLIIKIMSGKIKQQKHEIEQKDFAIKHAAQNLKVLSNHAEVIKDINKNHTDMIKRIGKVKEGDNEEINNILRDIISANNSRVKHVPNTD